MIKIARDLFEYLKIAKDMALSLNPNFLNEFSKKSKEEKELEWVIKECDDIGLSDFIQTFLYDDDRMIMLRNSNLVRHQYVSYPLANYMNFKAGDKVSFVNRLSTGLVD